ncbi:MAG TPA: spore coat protein U domain-containing protein [Burkholderiaceae bacterium]|nr:spore coat protein U domain-containing protein [Burkholderiaceae bacterium]
MKIDRTPALTRAAPARLLCLLALCASAGGAQAASCSVSFPATINLGVYNTVNALQPAPWTFTVTCTRTVGGGQSETVSLRSFFSVGSGTFANRTLRGSPVPDTLNYNLFADAAYTQVRGDGSGGTFVGGPVTLTLTAANPTQQASGQVYARVPGGQNVAPGTYSTTAPVVISITF